MYCPSCGHAIQIVPDFEPDIEDKIEIRTDEIKDLMGDKPGQDPLGQTKEIGSSEPKKDSSEESTALQRIEERRKQRSAKKISVRMKVLSFILVAAMATAMFIVVRSRIRDRYSVHIRAAVAHMAEEDYKSAYDEYLAASQKEDITDESYVEAMLGASDAAFYGGDDEEAVRILKEVLEKEPESIETYEKLIKIYESEDDLLSVNDLIASCPVSSIYEKYKEYLILPPQFSQGGGQYEEDVALELEATDGVSDIFYTIDGSIPDENSTKYTGPIVLSEGSFIISAVCRNGHGYLSPVVSEEFTIVYDKPDSPSVTPEEGKKSLPEQIRAEAPAGCRIFYTSDGSEPDGESTEYEGEIPMPLGKSRFRFIAVDEKGRVSEEKDVSYDLKMAAAFSPQDGINYLIMTLFNAGTLSDIEGHAPGLDGVFSYRCDSCYASGDRIYYLLYEVYKSGGEKKETGNIYALDFKTLELYRARRGDDGNFTFEMYY